MEGNRNANERKHDDRRKYQCVCDEDKYTEELLIS